jgi:ribosomal protein S18 acetylase RimI-like enzyme
MTTLKIRKAVESDIPSLLPLMCELAEFEGYAKDFAVTEEVLREQGFRSSSPDFQCLIAEEGAELVGFLVYYFVPFTYRAKPNLIIKELYIADRHRSRGIGRQLMKLLPERLRRPVVA